MSASPWLVFQDGRVAYSFGAYSVGWVAWISSR